MSGERLMISRVENGFIVSVDVQPGLIATNQLVFETPTSLADFMCSWGEDCSRPKPELEKLCEHGKGITDYCEPCGRVNGGG